MLLKLFPCKAKCVILWELQQYTANSKNCWSEIGNKHACHKSIGQFQLEFRATMWSAIEVVYEWEECCVKLRLRYQMNCGNAILRTTKHQDMQYAQAWPKPIKIHIICNQCDLLAIPQSQSLLPILIWNRHYHLVFEHKFKKNIHEKSASIYLCYFYYSQTEEDKREWMVRNWTRKY